MHLNLHSQKGFTLAESLIVLTIFITLSSVTIFSLKPQQTMVEDEAFLTQLQADLYYAQNYAIAHQNEVLVIFIPNQYRYKMSEHKELKTILERKYSKSFYLTEGSIPLTFKFLPNGNVSGFGSFFIRTEKKTYRLTIMIGRGRFYVKEQ
ncbi:competence type IV pilus minor pilin ComGD [Bacillus rubiinfantis]|uniref:competence type IV pilus minor pilin ComGD n=1 Tax=Bacillus rubiinfantis TaxID=1499680 RepID=UPI0005A91A0D|nr:competence type IV pilus minor pilin ComGD [Bacillus rubiinfantis]